MAKKALISGIAGQDGSYLADLLLSKGYEVHGIVSYCFENEISIFNNNVNSTHTLLAAIKEFVPQCKIYFAGTSEMFGLVKNYREQYGIFTCTGILYNHESPRRGYEFVTRKIVSSAVRIKLGIQNELVLGNLDAYRDWGVRKRLCQSYVANATG